MPYKRLFLSSDKPKDGLTQEAREAIVDVLHFCMYADRHIAASEDVFIEKAARTLDWSPTISYESYEAKSTGAVTRALSDASLRAEFFGSLKARLAKSADRELALALAGDLMVADGAKTAEESKALVELQQGLA
ncbi:MAG TPA: hypothetical protein VGE76_13800 [Opitutaceae bacterium]